VRLVKVRERVENCEALRIWNPPSFVLAEALFGCRNEECRIWGL